MTDPNPFYADGCPKCLARDNRPTTGIADGCPKCLARDNRPTTGIADGRSLTAAYRCRGCRHIWTCTWAVVPGRVLPPAPAIGEAA